MIPSSLQSVLWSKTIRKLDLAKDKNYIVHQLLALGSLKNLKWLFKTFPKKEIVHVFVKYPHKIYTKSSFNFAKNIILRLKTKFDEKKYLKTSS